MIEALKEHRLMKRLTAINRENIPERAVFAKGAGAKGSFRPYMSMRDYTAAGFLSDAEKETPVFVRFSKALGGKGGGETGRDLRGFAVRFYTEAGNYDLLSASLPVFCTGKSEKLPELMEGLKREKDSNLKRPEEFWSFVVKNPEAIHMMLHLYGDKGIVKSYRHMAGYSVNTAVWKNNSGKRFLVRTTWFPMKGIRSITKNEGEFLDGFDPDAASRDLYEGLSEGATIEFELLLQLVQEEKAGEFDFDLTDATKLWPHHRIPPVKIGKMKLTEAIKDYLTDVEKAAFSPANLVKGIEFSTDSLLPIMAFAMEDGHRHRLGAGYEELAVNKSKAAENQGLDSEFGEDGEDGGEESKGITGASFLGRTATEQERKAASYHQAGEYYRTLSEDERVRLADDIADDLMFFNETLQEDLIRCFVNVDPGFGKRIAKRLSF